jgi:(E)-4-hydroxy-3-methylbut-2-enyl-diphosphate synthase
MPSASLPVATPAAPAAAPSPFGRRRATAVAHVRGVPVGAPHPVVVQSMTNTDTADAAATAAQAAALFRAGSQVVRITVNNDEAAAAVPEIRQRLDDQGVDVPLVGDFHYNGHLLLTKYPATAATLDKYRINPGNVGTRHRDANFTQSSASPSTHASRLRIGSTGARSTRHAPSRMMDRPTPRRAPRGARTSTWRR